MVDTIGKVEVRGGFAFQVLVFFLKTLRSEPGDAHAGFDCLLAEGFEEDGFPGPEGSQTNGSFAPGDPFQCP